MPDVSLTSRFARLQLAVFSTVLLALSAGCRDKNDSGLTEAPPPEASRPTNLRLFVVDDEPLAEAIERHGAPL